MNPPHGLAAADGVARWLEERGFGFDTGLARVPIVSAAVLFDLPLGRADVRPDAAAGYAACQAASSAPVAQGNVGAATGASAGKWLGFAHATKTGLGSSAIWLPNGLIVAALAVVNALGNVIDPLTGRPIAGARDPERAGFASPLERWGYAPPVSMALSALQHTTLAVVATNATLSKAMAQRVAMMAHDGLARTINPVHTLLDGDVVFALSAGEVEADVSVVGTLAAEALAQAVLRAVWGAEDAYGLPCAATLQQRWRGQD
ncbi:MAG: P1 family peptidase [Thermoflexales bacterium]